jgi:hypothetical protein
MPYGVLSTQPKGKGVADGRQCKQGQLPLATGFTGSTQRHMFPGLRGSETVFGSWISLRMKRLLNKTETTDVCELCSDSRSDVESSMEEAKSLALQAHLNSSAPREKKKIDIRAPNKLEHILRKMDPLPGIAAPTVSRSS